jgi:hypothetical protein
METLRGDEILDTLNYEDQCGDDRSRCGNIIYFSYEGKTCLACYGTMEAEHNNNVLWIQSGIEHPTSGGPVPMEFPTTVSLVVPHLEARQWRRMVSLVEHVGWLKPFCYFRAHELMCYCVALLGLAATL